MFHPNDNCLVIFQNELTLGTLVQKYKTDWEIILAIKPEHVRIRLNESCIIPYKLDVLTNNACFLNRCIVLENKLMGSA